MHDFETLRLAGVWLAQCFEITLQTQHFKIFHQTQFSVTMSQTCIITDKWHSVGSREQQGGITLLMCMFVLVFYPKLGGATSGQGAGTSSTK